MYSSMNGRMDGQAGGWLDGYNFDEGGMMNINV